MQAGSGHNSCQRSDRSPALSRAGLSHLSNLQWLLRSNSLGAGFLRDVHQVSRINWAHAGLLRPGLHLNSGESL